MPKLLVVGTSGYNLPALHSKIAQLTGNATLQARFSRLVVAPPKAQSDAQQLRMVSRAAFAWASFFPPKSPAAQVQRAAAAEAQPDCALFAAAVSETHLDDDAVPSLQRLLPSDFAVPVYFICGERYLALNIG